MRMYELTSWREENTDVSLIIRWSRTARTRVLEIDDWLRERSPEAADRFTDVLFEKLELLAEHPYLAQVYMVLQDPSIRRQVVGKYIVFYYVDQAKQTIHILTVRHGRQPRPTGEELLEILEEPDR